MKSKHFLVFDLWGDFAHFRKFYTTSSPQSYDFPPRTTISGILGAIVGLSKSHIPGKNEEYTKYFKSKDTDIALHISKRVNKQRVNLNYIDTKRNWRVEKGARTQVRAEFVKNPKYRIYFSTRHYGIYNSLKLNLQSHCSYYTVSLGLSELLADFAFVGEYQAILKTDSQDILANNIVSYNDRQRIAISQGDLYHRDVLPNQMDENRIVTERKEFIFKTNWQNSPHIKVQSSCYYQLNNGECIVPM